MKKLFEYIPVVKAEFNSENDFIKAIEFISGNGISVQEVFMPYPVETAEDYMKTKPFHAGKVAFWSGVAGLALAVVLLPWFQLSYPLTYGNKPAIPYISFIPVGFALFILFGALGLVLSFFLREHLFPGQENKIYTHSKFCILLEKGVDTEFLKEFPETVISDELYISQQYKLPLPLKQN